MKITAKRTIYILIFLFSLPALLFIYQPSWKLGGIGLLLGMIGMTLTPIAIFGGLLYFGQALDIIETTERINGSQDSGTGLAPAGNGSGPP